MKLRAFLTVFICSVAGLPLYLVGVIGTFAVLDSSWGQWIARMPETQPGVVAFDWLESSTQIERWVTFPLISLAVGAISALLYRRSDWRVSSLCCISFVFFTVQGLPITIERVLAALLYFLTCWVGMRLVSLRLEKKAQASHVGQSESPPR